jgi:hypothetical protein
MVPSFASFADELAKIAGLTSKLRVGYHFSPRSKKDRWDKFQQRVKEPGFVEELVRHPKADEKLRRHAKSLHELHKGKVVATAPSTSSSGKTYEIRSLGPQSGDQGFQNSRLGCTCNDWRYNRSVQLEPGRECKHIRAFRRGEVKAA